MKLLSGIALALLAIATFINSVTAIQGITIDMNANSSNDSVLSVVFEDTVGIERQNQVLNMSFVVRGNVGTYHKMRCFIELDTWNKWSKQSAVERTRLIEMSEFQPSAGNVGFKGSLRLRRNDYLGFFQLICSFIPSMHSALNFDAAASVSINSEEAFVTNKAVIWPFNGFASEVGIYIADEPHTDHSSSLTIRNPLVMGKSFRVEQPSKASTGGFMVFRDPGLETECDATWDGVLYPKSVLVKIGANGAYMDLEYQESIHTATKIVAYCPEIYGYKLSPYLPALYEVAPRGITTGQVNYAVITTPKF